MKEKRYTTEKIINTLTKKSFIEIEPICDECISELILILTDVFTNIHFDIFQIEDNLYCLRISV